MKRLSYALWAMVTLITLGSAILMAQNAQQPPAPGPEVKKLDYFAGNWKSEGEMKPSSFGPGGKFTGTEHNEWMPGGFFLLLHGKETTSMGNGTSVGVYGYNTEDKVYTFDEFNSNGESVHAKGTLAGDTWTWTNEEKMQGKTMRGRFTVKVTSPTSYTFKFEMSPEGGDWSTLAEGKVTKTP
jgi:Protein of unknown function (DUF1579)